MGYPASVVLAETTMQKIEKSICVNTVYHVLSWKKIVDDCFSIVRNDEIKDLFTHINSITENIQFTIEKEENGKLPFHDTAIIRSDNGSLNFNVYRKPISNHRHLDYNSSNPSSHKQNIAAALQKRALAICEGEAEKFQELMKVKKDLRENGYPDEFISKCENIGTKYNYSATIYQMSY